MERNKANKVLVIFTIILTIITILLAGIIYMNKDKICFNNKCIDKKLSEKNINKKDEIKKCKEINYDLKTNEYGLSANGAGLNIFVDETRKNVEITYNKYMLSNTFSLDLNAKEDKGSYESLGKKHFDKKITEVLIDGSGQDATSLTILYLMEDGTVEYVPILKDLKANWKEKDVTQKLNSYGKLEGIDGIVSLISAEGKGYHTVLARKADGSVIDLSEALKKAEV